MADIYHQAEIVPLHHYNTVHMQKGGFQTLENSLDALEWLAENRPDMINTDLLRLCSVRLNRLIQQVSKANLKAVGVWS